MKSIVISVGLIICSVLAYACSKSDKDSKAIQTASNISLMSDNFKSEEDMEEYPHYLPVDSANRRMLDSCMLEHDTITFAGKKYLYTQYLLYPSEYKSFFVNYTIHTYEFNDTTCSTILTPKGRLVLCDTPASVTIVNVSDEDYYDYCDKSSVKPKDCPIYFILDMLYCDTIPIAEFVENSDDMYAKVPTWKSHYKKVYSRTGLHLKNTDGENNEWFLKYPVPARKGASKKELRKSAKQLPPFLFYDPFDYERLFCPALNYNETLREDAESVKKAKNY